jgi:hypothetical protein
MQLIVPAIALGIALALIWLMCRRLQKGARVARPCLLAGLDDVASETQLSEGWAFVVLTQGAAARLATQLQTSSGKRPHFHARKFKSVDATSYENFLKSLRTEAESSSTVVLAFTLMDLTWKDQFIPFLDNLIQKGVGSYNGVSQQAVVQLQRLFPGLATLLRMLKDVGRDYDLEVEIDNDSLTESFDGAEVVIDGARMPMRRVLSAVYRSYGSRIAPNAPVLLDGGIRVVSDSKSIVVQAADVLGNFAMSYAFMKLGRPSKKIRLKGEIFERVFGDLVAHVDIPAMTRLVGNDLQLVEPGSLTLHMS